MMKRMRLTKLNKPRAIIATHRIPKENAKGLKSGVVVLRFVRFVTELNNEKMKIPYNATVTLALLNMRCWQLIRVFFLNQATLRALRAYL